VLAPEFAGGGHNDTWVMVFPVAGRALAMAGRSQLGAALWPIGVGVEWVPAINLPLLAARNRRGLGWWGLGTATVGVVALSTLARRLHRIGAAAPISSQLRRASSTSIPYYVEHWFRAPQNRVTQVLAALFVVAFVFVESARRGRRRLGLTAGLLCLSVAWLPAWYVAWPVSLASVEDDRGARWLALALTAWLPRDAATLR